MKTILKPIAFGFLAFLFVGSFALSQNMHVTKIQSLKEKGKSSGWIGVMIQDVSEKIAKKNKLTSEEGAYVQEVEDDSPADSAGLKSGDVIVEFNGSKITDADDLIKAVQKTASGTKVTLNIVRDSEKKSIKLTVGKSKQIQQKIIRAFPPIPGFHVSVGNTMLGLRLLTLNEQLAEYFGAPNNEGVLIEEVEKESLGEKAGFKAGDVITRVGKKSTDEAEKVRREWNKHTEGEKVDFEVLRKGVKKILTVEVEEGEEGNFNYFFRSPKLHHRSESFDDTGLQLELERMRPNMDHLRLDLEQSLEELGNSKHTIRERLNSTQHLVNGAAAL